MMRKALNLLTTLLASQENLHQSHLSVLTWSQMNFKCKKKNVIQTFLLHCQSYEEALIL